MNFEPLNLGITNATISKHLAGISRNKPAPELTTYEAMLRCWESDALLTPQSMVRAIHALEYAVARVPDCGQIWSMLAAQYVDNYGLEIVDLATPLEKAAVFAQRGVRLDPTNRCARMILAYVQFNDAEEVAEVINAEGGPEDCIDEAIESCPVECIHWED